MKELRRVLGPKHQLIQLTALFGSLSKGLLAIKDRHQAQLVLAGLDSKIWATCVVFYTKCFWPCNFKSRQGNGGSENWRLLMKKGFSFHFPPWPVEKRLSLLHTSQGDWLTLFPLSYTLLSEKQNLICSVPMEGKLWPLANNSHFLLPVLDSPCITGCITGRVYVILLSDGNLSPFNC